MQVEKNYCSIKKGRSIIRPTLTINLEFIILPTIANSTNN